MLQNRVDPFGNIFRTSARGTLMGNRGVIHNDKKEIVRPFKLKAWIACRLSFKERSRVVMTPQRWTELFFLDEATAFAAGHRPCAECRRGAFNNFKLYWIQANPAYGFTIKTPIRLVDEVLHTERMDALQQKKCFNENLSHLPDGSFVQWNGNAYLVKRAALHLWTPFGYTEKLQLPANTVLSALTPKSVVNAYRAGYQPQVQELPVSN